MNTSSPPVPAVNQPAPSFEASDLSGRAVRLEDYRGRVVLLYFWSSDCPWVERVDQRIAQLPHDLAAAGLTLDLVVIAVASNASEPLDQLRAAALARSVPLVLLDPHQCIARRYGAQITPHCFLIDPAGILRYHGAFDDVSFRQRNPTRSFILEALLALASGQPIPITETPPFGCTIVPQEAIE